MEQEGIFDAEADNIDEEVKNSKFDFVPHDSTKRKVDGDRSGLKLRACISCRLILTETQFYENGCGNCGFLQMDGDRRRTLDCTSANFNGLIAIMEPQKSWSARYNNLSDVIPGCYAISVTGVLPEFIRDELGD